MKSRKDLRKSRNGVLVLLLAGTAFLSPMTVCVGQEPAAEEAQPAVEAPVAETPATQETAPVAEPATPEKSGRDWISGSFDAYTDAIWSDNDSDINLNQTLRLKIDPPQTPRLHLRGLLWMHEDLDSDESSTNVLRDINDASGSDVRARLLNLYADIDDLWGDSTLRIGRQRIEKGSVFNRIDGLSFTQRVGRWEWYLFAGARATVYDDAHNDLVLGGGVAYRPTARTRLALDAYYGEEHRGGSDEVYLDPIWAIFGYDFPRRVKEDLGDNLFSLSLWQQLTENASLFGRVSLHDGELDEISLQVTGNIPAWELSYELSYRGRFETASDRVNDLTSFYRVVGSYEEYDNFLAALHKVITKRLELSMEAEFHNADNDSWRTANRDYNRYALILAATPLFEQVAATVALEKWDVSGGDDTWALTGELSRQWKKVEVTLGADYERFEDCLTYYDNRLGGVDRLLVTLVQGYYAGYNPVVFLFDEYSITTHEDVYSVYLKTKWAIRDNQDVTMNVSYETDEGPDTPYWRVQAGYTVRF